jgi:hypothetical protein
VQPLTALSPTEGRRTLSFIHGGPLDDCPLWFFPESSFVVRGPPRPKRRRRIAARTPVKPDPWQPIAGRLELVADVARQCARAARSRDPGALDILFDRVRVALLDAIKLYNTSEELIR